VFFITVVTGASPGDIVVTVNILIIKEEEKDE
jgi:hypothetical protein